jgi:chemotaxis protein methyltransferase CheR
VYATDLSEVALDEARHATYPLNALRRFTENYQRAGGSEAFSRYYTADHKHARLHAFLREPVIFAQHNLASDASFNEFHLILCRNVLIYFDDVLKARVLGLFRRSLVRSGYLGLGKRELLAEEAMPDFEVADAEAKLYRARRGA